MGKKLAAVSKAMDAKAGKKRKHEAADAGQKGGRAEVPAGKGDGMEEAQVLLISRAIADPRRMEMLRAIGRQEATCCGMMECTGVSAATVSHHMKQLQGAGLIETTKEGRFLQAKLQRKVWKSYLASLKAIAG